MPIKQYILLVWKRRTIYRLYEIHWTRLDWWKNSKTKFMWIAKLRGLDHRFLVLNTNDVWKYRLFGKLYSDQVNKVDRSWLVMQIEYRFFLFFIIYICILFFCLTFIQLYDSIWAIIFVPCSLYQPFQNLVVLKHLTHAVFNKWRIEIL